MSQPITLMYEGKSYTVEELLEFPEGEKAITEYLQQMPVFTEEKSRIHSILKISKMPVDKKLQYVEAEMKGALNKFNKTEPIITMSDQELRLEILKIVISFASQTNSIISTDTSLEETQKIYNYIKNGKLPTNAQSKTE